MLTAKFVAFLILVLLVAAPAAGATPMVSSGAHVGVMVPVDWQEPLQLPPRFRNHCAIEKFTGRPYCSDHCGADYQFYYCSPTSFGCCRLGRGYCAANALLRCAP